MLTTEMDVYIPVVVLSLLGIVMVLGALLVGFFLRPKNPNKLKLQPYECGEDPFGSAWANFNVRFYVVALIFIIFDVEGALMFPVAAVFKKFNEVGAGGVVLLSMLIFIAVLIQGIVYCWKKGDLDWVKSFTVSSVNNENSENKQGALSER
ncbi:MAG: NADH-quinone oxidoreductase subunit A [Halobacteriovoraceae bacterium]|nr:NADH-quinone oxidoreductase subunit A [Halobacteriovoraceae bacterium]